MWSGFALYIKQFLSFLCTHGFYTKGFTWGESKIWEPTRNIALSILLQQNAGYLIIYKEHKWVLGILNTCPWGSFCCILCCMGIRCPRRENRDFARRWALLQHQSSHEVRTSWPMSSQQIPFPSTSAMGWSFQCMHLGDSFKPQQLTKLVTPPSHSEWQSQDRLRTYFRDVGWRRQGERQKDNFFRDC